MMETFYTFVDGKKVIDYARHVMEGVFPEKLFRGRHDILQRNFKNQNSINYIELEAEYLDQEVSSACFAPILADREIIESKEPRDVLAAYKPDDFQRNLFAYLREKGFEVPAFYNKAGISRQLFSNILTYDKEYTPTKETLFKIIFTLELDYQEARDLLSTKGYTISNSLRFDVVMGYCLENHIYDQAKIDGILFENAQTTLFSER